MQIYTEPQEIRTAIREAQSSGRRVGLVPTMGALHEGHLSLVRAARAQCDLVALTIFVNPTQFAPGEDLDKYPRPLDADITACERAGVDWVFTPTVEAMYHPDASTTVHVSGLTEGLCGRSRPGHFDGVTTVVTKLFQMLPADVAYFGEKDYQQLMVIRRMVRDLDFPIEIVGCPIVREPDGLAMSSRNVYLSGSQRQCALSLSRALLAAQAQVAAGERDATTIVAGMRRRIEDAGVDAIDYIEIVDPNDLTPLTRIDGPARICLAARVGSCRLIDNIGVEP